MLAAATCASAAAGCARRGAVGEAAAPPPKPTVPLADAAADTVSADADSTRPGGAIDPSTALRFEIVAVGDTTFDFLTPRAPWIRAGVRGNVVDPRRRDALVARFRVAGVRADTATAVVTGQTARVVVEHVVLLPRPAEPPPPPVVVREVRTRLWPSLLVGGAFGFALGLLLR